MKKVLIVGYLHPYTWRQMGSFRLLPLTRHLPLFGWEPVVLTAPLKENPGVQFKIIEAPCEDILSFWMRLLGIGAEKDAAREVQRVNFSRLPVIDFALNRVGEIINFPDSEKKWKKPALDAANAFLQHESVDALISCHPKTSHIIASVLKAEIGVPWVADFPDLWSQNHNYRYSPLRRALDRRLERKTLSKANTLTTVSELWAEKLRSLHTGKPVATIPHGFNPAAVNDPPAKLSSKFTITYTGSIYWGRQNPSKFLAALSSLISDDRLDPSDLEVRFYGVWEERLDREIKKFGLPEIVHQLGSLSNKAAMEKQRESQVLLMFDWDDPKEKGVYTGKIYEYLGSRRSILATGGASGDVVGQLLDKTGAGMHAVSVDEIKTTLHNLYHEYKSHGEVAYKGRISEVGKYSHLEMAKKFADILDVFVSVRK